MRFYYFDDDNKQRYKCGFKTKADAEKALDKINQKKADKISINVENTPFKDYLEEWMNKLMLKNNFSPCTERGYRVNIKNHIIPHIGHKKFQEITCRDLEDFYLKLWDNGKGLKRNTIKYVRATLLSVYKDALKDRLVGRNEAILSETPNLVQSKTFKYVIYSLKEILRLIQAVEGTYFEVAIALAGLVGLRRGEVLGLKYTDIDFVTGKIKVFFQLVYENGEYYYKTVKADSGREFYIPAKIRDIILKNKKRQEGNEKLFGTEYIKDDYIVCNPDGSKIQPGTFSKKFKSILSQNDFKPLRFHDLRHSANTLMQAYGIGREERKIITGHATDQMDEHYIHVQDESLKTVSKTLDERIFEIEEGLTPGQYPN